MKIIIGIFKYIYLLIKMSYIIMFLTTPLWGIIILIDSFLDVQLIRSLSIFLILLFIVYCIHILFKEMRKSLSLILSILMFFINMGINVFVATNMEVSTAIIFIPNFSLSLSVITYFITRYGIKRMINYYKELYDLKA